MVVVIKYIQTMQQKILLINSMQKLINHIVVSKKNQQEIFASLSKNDFKKIISNLDDDNLRLRKISLALISQLLHNNPALKEKFCNTMNIPLLPGRIALNTKLCPSSSRAKNTVTVDMSKNIKEVFTLLKQPIPEVEKNSLFWYINFQNKNHPHLQLEYVSPPHPQNLQINDLLDPIDSMVGFVLTERPSFKKQEPVQQSPIVQPRRRSEYQVNTSNRLVNNYFKPGVYKPQSIRQTPANLNQSLNMTPGYSTDREIGYAPKSTISGIKPVSTVNSSMYQQSTPYHFHKPVQNTIPPPLHQIKTNTMDSDQQNRQKYIGGGIKLISNAATTVKGREAGKYFEESPLYSGSLTSANKPNVYVNGGNMGMVGKNSLGGRVERGYETLREKKIIQKYPVE